MSKVFYSQRAALDLQEIFDRIFQDSPRYAEAFVARLEQKAMAAARHPQIYRRRTDLPGGLRSIPVGRYLIFFRIATDGIVVIRIVHSARELKRLFEN